MFVRVVMLMFRLINTQLFSTFNCHLSVVGVFQVFHLAWNFMHVYYKRILQRAFCLPLRTNTFGERIESHFVYVEWRKKSLTSLLICAFYLEAFIFISLYTLWRALCMFYSLCESAPLAKPSKIQLLLPLRVPLCCNYSPLFEAFHLPCTRGIIVMYSMYPLFHSFDCLWYFFFWYLLKTCCFALSNLQKTIEMFLSKQIREIN